MGFFHLRPVNPPASFFILSPLDPQQPDGLGSEVGRYTCFDHEIIWYFCNTCGVRTFAAAADFEVVEQEIEIPVAHSNEYETKKEVRRVCKIKANGEKRGYLSINMTSIDAYQPGGFDLRHFADLGCIQYLEWLNDTKEHGDKPYPGGMY